MAALAGPYEITAHYEALSEQRTQLLEQQQAKQNLLNTLNQGVPIVVSTKTNTVATIESTKATPVEISQTVVESTLINDRIVNVYANAITEYESAITNKHYKVTTTTETYSDSATDVRIAVTFDRLSQDIQTHTEKSRYLTNQYILDSDNPYAGTPTLGVLTVNEYKKRADVSSTGSDFFFETYNIPEILRDQYSVKYAPYAQSLLNIKAPQAWANGWTGKGSIIAIADSGIDVDHPEFENKILDYQCFSYPCRSTGTETIADLTSHGSHVAGIAAAAFDGVGMTGVAPDAELIIIKATVGTNGNTGTGYVFDGAAWAAGLGAHVINMSFTINANDQYTASMQPISPGLFHSTDQRTDYTGTYTYAESGFLAYNEKHGPDLIAAFEGNEMVAVIAAGNDGLPFVSFPGTLSTVYKDGQAMYGERILIAGNYNPSTDNNLANDSNMAGTVCFDYNIDNNSCNSPLRVSDYYLLAPGTNVIAPNKDGEYVSLSGTSMAAPMISGAIAVVRQMWPHMTGPNLVKLLLKTANKGIIPNYQAHIHGQGLLDLDEATKPQGAVGIPTSGRADGTKVVIDSTTASISMPSQEISALAQVMIIDDFERDFYINANQLIQTKDTRSIHPTQQIMNNQVQNAYSSFVSGTVGQLNWRNKDPWLKYTIGENISNYALEFNHPAGWNIGLVKEQDRFLGYEANNAFVDITGALSLHAGYKQTYPATKHVNIIAGLDIAATSINLDTSAMLKQSSTLISNQAQLGFQVESGSSRWGSLIHLPVTITSGTGTFEMASHIDEQGTIHYQQHKSSLAGNNREVDIGLFYNNQLNQHLALNTFIEYRHNYAGISNRQHKELRLILSGQLQKVIQSRCLYKFNDILCQQVLGV